MSPVAVMVLISLMLRRNALRNATFFLLGFTPTLLALGYVFVFVLHVGGSGGKSDIDGYIDIALGVLCLLAIILVYKKKPREKKPEEDVPASRAAMIGCLTMLANYSTLIIFISGIHLISAEKLSLLENILSVALLTLVTLWTLLVPIGIYVAVPSKAERMLAALKEWLSRHNKEISAAILLLFGVLLLVKGIRAF